MNRFTAGTAFRITALLGLLGVGLGAMGAHGLKEVLAQHQTTSYWEKAAFYHLVHTVVMLVVAGLRPWPRLAWIFFALGIAGFSGSLYVLALVRVYWLNLVTPLGGVFFLVGWLLLALRRRDPATFDSVAR